MILLQNKQNFISPNAMMLGAFSDSARVNRYNFSKARKKINIPIKVISPNNNNKNNTRLYKRHGTRGSLFCYIFFTFTSLIFFLKEKLEWFHSTFTYRRWWWFTNTRKGSYRCRYPLPMISLFPLLATLLFGNFLKLEGKYHYGIVYWCSRSIIAWKMCIFPYSFSHMSMNHTTPTTNRPRFLFWPLCLSILESNWLIRCILK